MSSLFSKVACCGLVPVLKINSFKDIFKGFANVKSYFFLCLYRLETAGYKEHLLGGDYMIPVGRDSVPFCRNPGSVINSS